MNRVLSNERGNSKVCTFDQRQEIQFIRIVALATVVVGFDPAKDDLANLFPLHAGAVELVD